MREQETTKSIASAEGSQTNSTKRIRRRWSQEEKRQWMEKWKRSGQSRMTFCREQGLCYATFLSWTRETAAGEGGRFVEVRIQPETQADGMEPSLAEIVAPNGWRIRLPGTIDAARLREVISLIATC